MVFRWCSADIPLVFRWCFSNIPVVLRWCFRIFDKDVVLREDTVMFQWNSWVFLRFSCDDMMMLRGASMLFRYCWHWCSRCLGDVPVIFFGCSDDVPPCSGDVPALLQRCSSDALGCSVDVPVMILGSSSGVSVLWHCGIPEVCRKCFSEVRVMSLHSSISTISTRSRDRKYNKYKWNNYMAS